jgi:hypothetical protein
MSKRTRLFLFVATGILVAGLGTGLLASYMDIQNLVLIGGQGPAELAYVSPDTRILAYADVRQVMDSELRQKLLQFEAHTAEGADKFQEETGIDLRTDVDKVVAALSRDGSADGDRPLVLVRGRFDTARIESLIRQKGGQVQDYQGIRLLTHPNDQMGVAFVEPGLVAVGTANAVRRAIDTKASGNDVTDNAEVMNLVQDIDDGNAWGIARFDALANAGRLPEDLAKQLPAISWFSATGTINGGIHAVVRAEARDDVAANDLRDVIRGFIALARMQTGQRAEFATLMNSFELGGQGKTVSVGFAVPADLIDALAALRARQPRPEAQPEVGPSLEALPNPSL